MVLTSHLCFVQLSGKTATFALYTNRLVVYNRDGVCLLRGTDWVFKYSSLCLVFKELIKVVIRTPCHY